MKRNFDTILIALDGDPFRTGVKYKIAANGRDAETDANGSPVVIEAGVDLTLRKACLDVLGVSLRGDEALDGEAKFKLYQLAAKIDPGGVVDLDEKEIASLKDRTGRAYSAMLVGAIYTVLNTDYMGS